jgi:microcystin-dependent protein
MSQPYVGQILMFGGSFAPAGWMLCQGQLVPISENETLFNLIGTTYGGDGQETFGLPNLSGRVPIHQGQGGGLSNYSIGETAGTEQVTLTQQQIPQHNHLALVVSGSPANSNKPNTSAVPADQSAQVPGGGQLFCYAPTGGAQQAMSGQTIQGAGGSQPHENIQPILTITYVISLFGVFPTQ